jgi:hypothetical protein
MALLPCRGSFMVVVFIICGVKSAIAAIQALYLLEIFAPFNVQAAIPILYRALFLIPLKRNLSIFIDVGHRM